MAWTVAVWASSNLRKFSALRRGTELECRALPDGSTFPPGLNMSEPKHIEVPAGESISGLRLALKGIATLLFAAGLWGLIASLDALARGGWGPGVVAEGLEQKRDAGALFYTDVERAQWDRGRWR
jgi:hypothetical protein